jgi:hypothetical protein
MKKNLCLFAALLLACGIQQITAQLANEGMAAKIIASRKANAALMKQYSWQSRTELKKDDKVEDIRIEQVLYGPDGELQRTVLNDEGGKMPRGFLRKKIAEDREKDMKKYFGALRKRPDQYTLPTAGKVLDFLDGAKIQAPDGNGLMQLAGSNVVSPGDQFTIWVDATTHKTSKVQITTLLEGDEVTATVTFKTLNSGLNYAEFTEVEIPSKGIQLQIQNYNYVNQNN